MSPGTRAPRSRCAPGRSVLLASWFFILLVTLTLAPPVIWAVLEVMRLRRRLQQMPVLEGWRVMLLRGWALITALLFGVVTTAVGLNRHYQYIPSFSAMAGDVSPDLVTGPAPAPSLATRSMFGVEWPRFAPPP